MSRPRRAAFRMPLRVEKRISSPGLARSCCQRTCAEARVAWPHKSTSTLGVNQRRSKWPCCLTRKAVSDRFISLATAWSHSSFFHDDSRQTAAGFPAKGRSVKASTWKRVSTIFSLPPAGPLCSGVRGFHYLVVGQLAEAVLNPTDGAGQLVRRLPSHGGSQLGGGVCEPSLP